MANPITSATFQQIAGDTLNHIFEDEYDLVELRLLQKWIGDAYPDILKEYWAVRDAGYGSYDE